MKKAFRIFLLLAIFGFQFSLFNSAQAQSCYWVLLSDKAGTSFDPYSYFDSKAIERYRLNNDDLYDISNYPLNQEYVSQVDALASGEVGQSRWLNAVAVMATESQIAAIERLPFVLKTDLIASGMEIAKYRNTKKEEQSAMSVESQQGSQNITNQLLRMEGNLFVEKGIDGRGVRIAVFDGGFHAVNTHDAFKHLRDNNQILATWDFTEKIENVYNNHTHGTMVLSCIAGRLGDRQLGLATGAEFLLARTEVEPEPFKEEVWWAEAAEWADKNGADIINSSLGYTKDRHYTWEMDGRSYVSKAANMAASKGILVCNSAGNSGSDENWKIIGAPADAEDILTVGGIMPSLARYAHIDFSSYGPTADGRMKPNVCSFGYAEVADPHNDTATDFAYGTSFSSPLAAGFCACAWQVMKDKLKNAREMKQMVEQSGDLYPYYDYAFGYGVPQASYFLNEENTKAEPTFLFEEMGKFVLIHPLVVNPVTKILFDLQTGDYSEEGVENVIMFKIQDRSGHVERYVNMGSKSLDESMRVAINKGAVSGNELVVHYNGYTETYRLSKLDSIYYAGRTEELEYYLIDATGLIKRNYTVLGDRTLADNKVSDWGVGQKYQVEGYLQYGVQWSLVKANSMHYSDAWNAGFRVMRNFRKWYALGMGLEVAYPIFRFSPKVFNTMDDVLGISDYTNVEKKRLFNQGANLELFQRIRLTKDKSASKKGLYWDMGVSFGYHETEYRLDYNENESAMKAEGQSVSYYNVVPYKMFQMGVTTRLSWNQIGVYVRYRFDPNGAIPRYELGLQWSFE